jgi:hypothetical protein
MARKILVASVLAVLLTTVGSSTEICRRRDYSSERSIIRITAGLGLGALFGEREVAGDGLDKLELIARPTFYIDGEKAEIWPVLLRLLMYIVDIKHDGEVQWVYVLRYEDFVVNRWTIVRDGYVHLITTINEPVARISWARLDTWARESTSGTRVQNNLTVSTPYGNRCGLVRRIAVRTATPILDDALLRIEREALSVFETGRSSKVAQVFADWYKSRRDRFR